MNNKITIRQKIDDYTFHVNALRRIINEVLILSEDKIKIIGNPDPDIQVYRGIFELAEMYHVKANHIKRNDEEYPHEYRLPNLPLFEISETEMQNDRLE